jgi:beta-galactosidase
LNEEKRMSARELSRREFVGAAAFAAVGLPVVLGSAYPSFAETGLAPYAPPASPRAMLNFNLDWKFKREDVSGGEKPGMDDSKWTTVSTPHSFNDVDSFRSIISHGGGDRGTWKGIVWYRKHFKLPAGMSGHKIYLEFEGMRQAGDIYLNGKTIGLYENGVTAYGVDISSGVNFGAEENVLAVKVNNLTNYQERAFCAANPKNADGSNCTNTGFEWNSNDFNPDHGGINRHVWLHVMGPVHQTLPLYYGLESQGTYVHASNFDIANKTADVTVESEVRNGMTDRATVGLTAVIVDHEGKVVAQVDADPVDMVAGEKTVMMATLSLKDARWWSDIDPYLYDVYTVLKLDGKVVDSAKLTTGFRKVEFKGGVGKGGVYINDRFVYLKGYAQRSSDEWAEVMRDSMIYFRNNPSILFWETGNSPITAAHMEQMLAIKKQYDFDGGRAMGGRGNGSPETNNPTTPIAEYFGVMIGQDTKTDQLTGPTDMFRAYSAERRDKAPLIETEDFRDEGARRYWDNY